MCILLYTLFDSGGERQDMGGPGGVVPDRQAAASVDFQWGQ